MAQDTLKFSESESQIHGVREVPREAVLAYGMAMLAIVGGDGEVSPKEWAYFEARSRNIGFPDDLLAAWKQFDPKTADVAALLRQAFAGGIPEKKTARAMLYDALTMAMADGVYAEKERATAERAAEWLGIDQAVVRAIEGIVQLEHTVAAMRRAIVDA